EWAEEEFADILTRAPKPAPAEPWRRLTGLHKIRGRRGLAIARAFWLARDELARAEDTAPGRLVPDRSVVAAVLAAPRRKADLAGLKEFTGRASRREIDRWWQAIVDGRDEADLPLERVPTDALPPA